MSRRSQVLILFVGLALMGLAPSCGNTNKQAVERERKAREEAERAAQRDRKAREEAEKARTEAEQKTTKAEKEAAVWKTYCVISLVASLIVLACWLSLTSPLTVEGSSPKPPSDPLGRRLSVSLLAAVVAQVGGLIGGFLANEFVSAVAALGGSGFVVTLTWASHSAPPTDATGSR